MMRFHLKILPGLILVAMAFLLAMPAWAQRVWKVDVTGTQFEPKELTVWPGDTIQFCNNGTWRRQPYTGEKYNRFSTRKPETHEMLKKGECKEMTVQNPTKTWLRFNVRDAVNMDMKLKLKVNPGPS